MTSIASSSLLLPVAEPKRDPAPNRAGGLVAGSAFKAALATASNGGAAENRQRPAPEQAEDKPTGKETAQPVLTLLALAKAASQSDVSPEAEPVEADAVAASDEAADETPVAVAVAVVAAAGKPGVGVVHGIAASPAAMAHAAVGAVLPMTPAVAKAADPVAAKDPKPSSGPKITAAAVLGSDADSLDPPSGSPSDATTAGAAPPVAIAILLPAVAGSVAAGTATPTATNSSTASRSTPPGTATPGAGSAQAPGHMLAAGTGSAVGRAQTSTTVNGATAPKAAEPMTPTVVPSAVEIGGSSARQPVAPVSPASTSDAAPAQASRLSAGQDIGPVRANTQPGPGRGLAGEPASAETGSSTLDARQPAGPGAAAAKSKAEIAIDVGAPGSSPASPLQALAATAALLPATTPVGSGPVATSLEPQTGAAVPAMPETAAAGLAAVAAAPSQAAAPPVPAAAPPAAVAATFSQTAAPPVPVGPAKPADEAVPTAAAPGSVTAATERSPSDPVSTLAQTAVAQIAEAVSAPVTKAAMTSDPDQAAAAAPVPSAVTVGASGSHGPSQDGAAGQGRGDERPPAPAITHEGVATKPVVAPAPVAAPVLAATGAPGPATSQVLQLFSSLGLTNAAEADTGADGSASDAPTAETATPAAGRPSSVPETMTLQLSPESLGRITVTLRLRGQALDVRLVADKRTTLESLGRDRQQLEAALGVAPDAIDIAFGPQTGSPAAEGAPQRSAPEPNSTASDQGHGRSQGRSQDAGTSRGEGDGTGTAASQRPAERRDGSLYL